MATPRYNRARDFGLLLKNLPSFSDNQARVVTYDEDHLNWVDIEIRPNGGLYKEGAFIFKLMLHENFPASCPLVRSISPIYHPNIDPVTQEVCLNLWGEWSPSFGMQDAIQGLLFLMYEPNLDSMLNDQLAEETFEEDVGLAMKGQLLLDDDDVDEVLGLFKTDNTEHVRIYYDKLATNKNIEGGATAAEAAIPAADVLYNHMTKVLDKERMNIELKPVDIPHSSMIPSNFHSRQQTKLSRSSSIHGLLFHPDFGTLATPPPPQTDSQPRARHILKRSVTFWSEEHMAHSEPFELSEHMDEFQSLRKYRRTDELQTVSMSDSDKSLIEGTDQFKAVSLADVAPMEINVS